MSANTTYECGYSFLQSERKSIIQMLNEEYLKRVLKIFEEDEK